jgi:hypothetical protein
MKRIALGIGLLAFTALGGVGTANAQGFGVYVGPDTPHHWDHHDWHHHHNWRGDYAYVPECRVIARTHINRWGERVTVRTRVCD